MPLTIVVRTEEARSERSLTFDGERIVIGRGPGSDMRLPDPSVSHRHAVIQHSGATWSLLDEGSSNGTFVGGARLAKRAPRARPSGDLVRVGRVWLEVRLEQTAPPTRDLAVATRDLAMQLVAEAMANIGDDVSTKVRVVEGPDRDALLPLLEEGRVYVIGRGEACDLPLADADASPEHARVVRRGSAVFVRDAGSKDGTFLGDQPLSARDAVWKPPATVRVGASVLALEEPVQLALEELEAAADELIPADAPIPEPRSKSAPLPKDPKPISPAGASDPKPARYSATDVTVALIAIAVIGLSIAGLLWLLRA